MTNRQIKDKQMVLSIAFVVVFILSVTQFLPLTAIYLKSDAINRVLVWVIAAFSIITVLVGLFGIVRSRKLVDYFWDIRE